LAIAPVQGEASSPKAKKLSGQVYNLASNDLGFKTMALKFGKSGCQLTVKQGRTTETLTIGYGKWQAGETKLFNNPYDKKAAVMVTSGAWTSKDTFRFILRFHDTPFYQSFDVHVGKDALTIETRVNVAFQPPETEVIKATLAT